MVVTVETRHGAQMPVIDKADVMVFEGRDRDTVTDWVAAQGDRAGLDLFILLGDASALSLGTQLEDIRQFIEDGLPLALRRLHAKWHRKNRPGSYQRPRAGFQGTASSSRSPWRKR